MRITFCFPSPDVARLRALDPDCDWRALQQGEEAWVLQGYLRLAQAGLPVELAATPPDDGLVVFHGKHKRCLARELLGLKRAVIVAIRGDLGGSLAVADFEVVQNPTRADGRRGFFLPSWPQPGLQPRDERRPDRLGRISYKGYLDNLHPAFRNGNWESFLESEHVDWDCDAVPFAHGNYDREALYWPDFRATDAVLAVRPRGRSTRNKPASKLYNAWHAGVPALLGPESAYQELRRSELDYLEVGSLTAARAAVVRLREEPGLWRAMIENGRRRAAEWTPAAVAGIWRTLLEETLPARAERDRRPWGGCVPPLRRVTRAWERLRWALLSRPDPFSRSAPPSAGSPATSSRVGK